MLGFLGMLGMPGQRICYPLSQIGKHIEYQYGLFDTEFCSWKTICNSLAPFGNQLFYFILFFGTQNILRGGFTLVLQVWHAR